MDFPLEKLVNLVQKSRSELQEACLCVSITE